jgi:hypothetical protein
MGRDGGVDFPTCARFSRTADLPGLTTPGTFKADWKISE